MLLLPGLPFDSAGTFNEGEPKALVRFCSSSFQTQLPNSGPASACSHLHTHGHYGSKSHLHTHDHYGSKCHLHAIDSIYWLHTRGHFGSKSHLPTLGHFGSKSHLHTHGHYGSKSYLHAQAHHGSLILIDQGNFKVLEVVDLPCFTQIYLV